MGTVKKTGIMIPRISLAYERSQITARVEEDLNLERVRAEQLRGKRKRLSGLGTCSQCLKHGMTLRMPIWMLEKHLLNHRILQALGQEKEWIQEIKEKNEKRKEKFELYSKRKRCKSLAQIEKAKNRDTWLWQRTILRPREVQRRRIAWITLRMGEPIWIVPITVWPKNQSLQFPCELERVWSLCHAFIERLALPEMWALLVSGWLSPSDKKYISEQCVVEEVMEKEVIRKEMIKFVRWRRTRQT